MMPSLLDAPPISGSTTPYRHRHAHGGYGADSFFNAKQAATFGGANTELDDSGLGGLGLQSIESVELVANFNESTPEKQKGKFERVLPEAAMLLYDTGGQEDIIDYRDKQSDPLLSIDVLGHTVADERSPSRSHRRDDKPRRSESRDRKHRSRDGRHRDRDSSPDKYHSGKKHRSRRDGYDSPQKERDRYREEAEVRVDPANLGYVQKLSAEDKARRRVQARLDRRYKASSKDADRRAEQVKAENEQQEKEYLDAVAKKDRDNMLTFANAKVDDTIVLNDRDKMSLNESHREHYTRNKRASKRHRDEQKEKESERYLYDRRGPGDRSVSDLEKERPVESALNRHGLMLLPSEDNGNVNLTLAYDAHDYEEQSPVRIRVANRSRQPRVMPQYVHNEGDSPLRTVSRENRSSLLGDAVGQDSARDGVTSARKSPSKAPKPSNGPGARLGMPVVDSPQMTDGGSPAGAGAGNDDDGVEVAPMQKYPMWTT
jgi:hypothetical protein